MGYMMRPHLFQGQFVIQRLGLNVINLFTKFEVSIFTHYEDRKAIQNVEIIVVLSGEGLRKVMAT